MNQKLSKIDGGGDILIWHVNLFLTRPSLVFFRDHAEVSLRMKCRRNIVLLFISLHWVASCTPTKLHSTDDYSEYRLSAESRLVYLSTVAMITANYDNLVDLELQWWSWILILFLPRRLLNVVAWESKARFKRRTLHAPNLMQMRKIENLLFSLICIRFGTC